jgi:hypothetical protein
MPSGLETHVKAAPLQSLRGGILLASVPELLELLNSLYSSFDNSPSVLLAFPNPIP